MEFNLEEEYSKYMTSFYQIYHCQPLSQMGKSQFEDGDKLIMPVSALDRLKFMEIDFPMLFEIKNLSNGRTSHCGVMEFTAEEGFVFVPNWMMKNMRISEGGLVEMKIKSLKKASFVKLQPHSKEFLLLPDPRKVLETALSKFSCLTIGDTIMIIHEGESYYLDVLGTRPYKAVSIIETNCELEFAPPLDLLKVEEKPSNLQKKPLEKKPEFVPFSGASRRLA